MGLSRSELVTLKAKIKAEMQRRNGSGPSNRLWTPSRAYGSVSQFAGSEYDFIHTPTKDGKIYSEYGRKTVDLLLQIHDIAGLESTVTGNPIPKTWNSSLIQETDRLSREQFNGETQTTINARRAAGESVGISPESSSCRAACTGLCIGSCIGMCNGCLQTCTASCGTGCTGGLTVSTT